MSPLRRALVREATAMNTQKAFFLQGYHRGRTFRRKLPICTLGFNGRLGLRSAWSRCLSRTFTSCWTRRSFRS
jgi:hypothetical protein